MYVPLDKSRQCQLDLQNQHSWVRLLRKGDYLQTRAWMEAINKWFHTTKQEEYSPSSIIPNSMFGPSQVPTDGEPSVWCVQTMELLEPGAPA